MEFKSYKYTKKGVTATITNKKRYWLLKITKDNGIIIIPNDCKIWNTKKGAKKYVTKLMSSY